MKENTFALIKLCLDLLLTFPYRNDKLEMKSHNETVDLLHGGYGHGWSCGALSTNQKPA